MTLATVLSMPSTAELLWYGFFVTEPVNWAILAKRSEVPVACRNKRFWPRSKKPLFSSKPWVY